MKPTIKTDLERFVPKRELLFLVNGITKEQIKESSITKEALIGKLAALEKTNSNVAPECNKLILNYKYAGQCSLSWSYPIKPHAYTKETIEELIKKKAKKRKKTDKDIFKSALQPKLRKEPVLNRAEWLSDTKLILEFVYADDPYFIEEDYEVKRIRPTRRINAIIRLLDESFLIEARAHTNKSPLLHREVEMLLDQPTNMVEFSDSEVKQLKGVLSAKKKSAKHKRLGSDFDTMEVSASLRVEDLDNSAEYNNLLGQDKRSELRTARCLFAHKPDSSVPVDVSANVYSKGRIWFRSSVSEETLDHVVSCVRTVKGL